MKNEETSKLGLDDSRHVGVIAQDVHAVLPELTTSVYEGRYMGVRYTELIPVLVNAIKELDERGKESRNYVSNISSKSGFREGSVVSNGPNSARRDDSIKSGGIDALFEAPSSGAGTRIDETMYDPDRLQLLRLEARVLELEKSNNRLEESNKQLELSNKTLFETIRSIQQRLDQIDHRPKESI